MTPDSTSELASLVRQHLDNDWEDGYDIDYALEQGILDAIRSRLGSEMTAEQINAAFPMLRQMDDFGIVNLDDSDDVVDRLDEYLCAAEGHPRSFWDECGLEFHERVVTIRSGEQGHSVDLGLVTDGSTDWWFNFLNTNVAGNGYGPPASTTKANRRAAIEDLVVHGESYLQAVDRVETSLRGTDLQWLTGIARSEGCVVVLVEGSMERL